MLPKGQLYLVLYFPIMILSNFDIVTVQLKVCNYEIMPGKKTNFVLFWNYDSPTNPKCIVLKLCQSNRLKVCHFYSVLIQQTDSVPFCYCASPTDLKCHFKVVRIQQAVSVLFFILCQSNRLILCYFDSDTI